MCVTKKRSTTNRRMCFKKKRTCPQMCVLKMERVHTQTCFRKKKKEDCTQTMCECRCPYTQTYVSQRERKKQHAVVCCYRTGDTHSRMCSHTIIHANTLTYARSRMYDRTQTWYVRYAKDETSM